MKTKTLIPPYELGSRLKTQSYAVVALRYTLAVLAAIGVSVIKHKVTAVGNGTPTLLYEIALVLVAILLGSGPAIVVLALSSVFILFLFPDPLNAVHSHWDILFALGVYVLDGALLIFIVSTLRRREHELREKNIQLRIANDRITALLGKALDISFSWKRDDDK